MDLGLREVGASFLIGGFTILGFELILYCLFNISITGFFKQKLGFLQKYPLKRVHKKSASAESENDSKTSSDFISITAVVFISLCFGVGIVTESFSYKFADNISMPFKQFHDLVGQKLNRNEWNEYLGLPSNENERVSVIVRFSFGKPTTIKPSELGASLATYKILSSVDPKNNRVSSPAGAAKTDLNKAEKLEEKLLKCSDTNDDLWVLKKSAANGPSPEVKDVIDAQIRALEEASKKECEISPEDESYLKNLIVETYYHSKNVVFKVPAHYDEMTRIQMRQDFTRSLSLVSMTFWFLCLIFGIGSMISIAAMRRFNFLKTETSSYSTLKTLVKNFSYKKVFIRMIVLLIIFFVVYAFGTWGYYRQAEEFNKRAFGYYRTLKASTKLDKNLDPAEIPTPQKPAQ